MSVTIEPQPAAKAANPAAISPQNYSYLQQYIYEGSGIVLDSDKHYLLESRLVPILAKQNLASLDDLCTHLRSRKSNELQSQVVEAMTTNETLFFRDLAPFDALRKEIIPQILKQRGEREVIRIWSAAASSGQEAYSLAMMLLEMNLSGSRFEIVGTDLSEQVLERARAGRYMQIEVNRGLPASYLVKYFKREGLDWQLKDEVRRLAAFRPFDLRSRMDSLGTFDVVLCRNVLIYFDTQTKSKILEGIHGVLRAGGHLMLGGAETVINLNSGFKRNPVGATASYIRNEGA